MKVTDVESKVVVRGGKRKSTYLLIPSSVAAMYRTLCGGDVKLDVEGTSAGGVHIDIMVKK